MKTNGPSDECLIAYSNSNQHPEYVDLRYPGSVKPRVGMRGHFRASYRTRVRARARARYSTRVQREHEVEGSRGELNPNPNPDSKSKWWKSNVEMEADHRMPRASQSGQEQGLEHTRLSNKLSSYRLQFCQCHIPICKRNL